MLWLLIFVLVILGVVCYLVFAPFYLEVNNNTGLYCIRFHRLAAARLVVSDGSLKIDLKIAWWRKQISLSATGRKKEKPRPVKKEKKQKRVSVSVGMIKAVIRSFKVNKCYLNIDTGDMPMNGILYPCFYALSKLTGKTFKINFLDKNEIILEIENNFARILRAFIFHQFIIKKQKNGQFK